MAEPRPDTTDEPAEGELAPERVAELSEAGAVELVDVRTDAEHASSRIPGARHVPLDRVADAAEPLSEDRPVVFYCRVGERSAMAAQAFRASGRDAHSLAGGLVAWSERGLPLEPRDGEVAHHSALPDR